MRLEWPADYGVQGDAFDPDAERRAPPWLDVIFRPDDGEAMLRLRLVRDVNGEPVRTAFEVDDPTGALTTRWLRRLGQGAALGEVDRLLEDWAVSRFLGDEWRRTVARPGRRGRGDAFYAEWAARYVDALENGGEPVRHLVHQETAEGRHTTEKSVRGYLYQARRRGLLTAAPKGKAGGELTDKGRAALGGGRANDGER